MVNVVRDSGFCHGVKAAVHKADEFIGKKVYLYGDLVNNRQVMARYIRENFIVANDVREIDSGSVVIIRAHGVGKKIYDDLLKINCEIVDCTCVKVKKIHKIVSAKKNERVIIVGKKNHPEVLGIFGWCDDAVVVENENELDDILNSREKKMCVVGQTTCNKTWWENSVKKILSACPDAEIFNTLCDVTAKRITDSVEIAKKSNAMIVIGDKKSANSIELFEACKAACENVFFVSSLRELLQIETPAGSIGLTGSASAPTETINEIYDFLLFKNFLSDAKNEIESACDNYLNELILSSKEKPFIEDAIADFYNQNQGGKRIRGALIKLGAEISGGKNYLSIAMAYEIFATAILIHDDIIDNSDTRRGKKTIHAQEGDSHFAKSRAICIGDYGLFLATKILAEASLPAEIFSKIILLFSEIQLTTLEGEIMDISSQNFCEKIYEYKTAWYTLTGPLLLGAICGGASDATLRLLREISLPLGFAFQIKDDLLGIFASEKILGKPALSDIIENKQTLLFDYAKKHATPQQASLLQKHYGNPHCDENGLETVREIFTETGARDFAENEIFRLSQISLSHIAQLESKPELLRGLVHFLINRRF
jgi:(E)-4-hydroxy-3-methyl-but-2-enyl pyrophosphate reductase